MKCTLYPVIPVTREETGAGQVVTHPSQSRAQVFWQECHIRGSSGHVLSPSAQERSALDEELWDLASSCLHAYAGPEVARPSGRSSEGWTGPLPLVLMSRGLLRLVTGQKPDHKELSGQNRGHQTLLSQLCGLPVPTPGSVWSSAPSSSLETACCRLWR